VKATAPADLRALPGRSEALLNAIAAKYADALRRQACRIEAAIVPRLSRTAARPVGQRGVGQLGVKRYRVGAHREPLNVRFAPRATELLRRREMSRRGPDMIAVCHNDNSEPFSLGVQGLLTFIWLASKRR
jgi:hypothetical protein